MWEGIFSDNNPVLNFLRRVADVTILNILFIITCIPVITIGASLTSLYYVSINAWARDDGYVFKMYFKSFKQNFKQATLFWFAFFAVFGALTINTVYWMQMYGTTDKRMYQVFMIIGAVLMIYVWVVYSYVWPLLAKFENTLFGTLKNAALMVVAHIPETIGLSVIPALFLYLSYVIPILRPFSLVFGFGIIGYMQALILRQVFKPYLGGEEEERMTPEDELDHIGVLSTLSNKESEEEGSEEEGSEEPDQKAEPDRQEEPDQQEES